MTVVGYILRWWAAFALLACLSLLGVAIIVFEKGLGYAPCHLCLEQREIYWATAALAVLIWIWAYLRKPKGTPPLGALVLMAGFGCEAWRAGFHAGVEHKWWHGPSTCTGGGAVDLSAIKNLLNGGVVHTPMCDVAVWSFAGVSMAGWNAIAAAVLAVISLWAFLEARRGR